MLLHVLFEVTSSCAWELALHASERLLSWMCQHVSHEVTFLCAFKFTLVAAERLFSGMNKNVLFQITSFGERGGTHGASVAFLSTLLHLGSGCKRHCTRFSGSQFSLVGGCFQCRPSFPSISFVLYQSYGLTERKSHESQKENHSEKSESELKYFKEWPESKFSNKLE